MAKVIIFGIGQIAEIALFYLTHDSDNEVAGFTVDQEYFKQDNFQGRTVAPFEEIEARFPPDEYKLFLPISYRNVNRNRAERYLEAKRKGYQFISYVCSKAVTWPDLQIGENCFIFEANVIQPFVKIGDNVIVWSGNHIGHHAVIEDHCFIASHVVVSGGVTVGAYSFLGVNATLRDNIKIAGNCVIGAGALILHDTVEYGVYVGNPATLIKKRSDELKGI